MKRERVAFERDDRMPESPIISILGQRIRPSRQERHLSLSNNSNHGMYPFGIQVSAVPPTVGKYRKFRFGKGLGKMELDGLEPTTPALQTRCSPN